MLAIALYIRLQSALTAANRALPPRLRPDQRGQASAEYALVLLGAAAIALLIVAWATETDLIGKLFEAVLKAVTGKVK